MKHTNYRITSDLNLREWWQTTKAKLDLSDSELDFIVRQHPLITHFSEADFENQFANFQENFFLDRESCIDILKNYPKSFFISKNKFYNLKIFFYDSLGLTEPKQMREFLTDVPFYLSFEVNQLNLVFFSMLESGYTHDEVKGIVKRYPLFFYSVTSNLLIVFIYMMVYLYVIIYLLYVCIYLFICLYVYLFM